MKSLLKKRIGVVNVIAIVIITVAIGFLSVFSLMNEEQAHEMRVHWAHSLLMRMGVLMGVSEALIGVLLVGNLVYGLITRDRGLKDRFMAVFIWASLITFITALTGSFFLVFS